MYLIVVHELYVFESDLYVVVMSCLVAFHVDYYHVVDASSLLVRTVAKSVLIHSCKLRKIN
jgi:hypothetical protein